MGPKADVAGRHLQAGARDIPLAATAWPDWDTGSADTDSLEARADRASIESILHPAVSAIANGLSCRNDPPPSLFLPPNRSEILEVHRGDLCARQRWFGDPSSPCGCFFDHSSRGPQESKTGLVALAATRSKTRSRSKCERGNRIYNRWLDRGAPLAPWSIRLNIRKTVLSHAGRHAESPKTG